MTSIGTRGPSPMRSRRGGTTWSYQPPQSSHTTTMAVELQNGPCPSALTTEATHSGPNEPVTPTSFFVVLRGNGWSEFCIVGTTHVIAGRSQITASLMMRVSGETTFCQRGENRMCLIASNADQMLPFCVRPG